MNSYQELWWKQAQADHAAYEVLRRAGAAPCHQLHYLQMVGEKIAKAHLWHSGSPPPKSHLGFREFMRYLDAVKRDSGRIANIFYFKRIRDFQQWITSALPLAYALECIVPALANNGPNSEYPWPHERPTFAPAEYDFDVWKQLMSSRCRSLVAFIRTAVRRFPEYATA
jgi:hypothetical protein